MTDFETHPVGTTAMIKSFWEEFDAKDKRIAELEADLARPLTPTPVGDSQAPDTGSNALAEALKQREELTEVVTALVAALEDRLHWCGDCDCAACVHMLAAIALAKSVAK